MFSKKRMKAPATDRFSGQQPMGIIVQIVQNLIAPP
jgi:hypothetical protein